MPWQDTDANKETRRRAARAEAIRANRQREANEATRRQQWMENLVENRLESK